MKPHAFLCALFVILAPTFPVSADQGLSDLLLRVERLQQEIQQLRGQIELQQHELSTLKRQQQEQYLDLDARLRGQSAAESPRSGQGDGRIIDAEAPQVSSAAAPNSPGIADAQPPSSQAVSQSPGGEKQAYQAAFGLLKQRRYDDAARALEDLLARYPHGELADNASYWLGETKYVKRDYAAALTQFQRVLKRYPLSPKVPGAMLKIGYIHYDQSDWQGARATLQNVSKQFPDSTEARLAESRLERMVREGH